MNRNDSIYRWERHSDDFLQCWPKDSAQSFLQVQPQNSFFKDIKNSENLYIPTEMLYDPLAARGILNSGIMRFGKLYYQERTGVDFCQIGYVTKGSVFIKSTIGDIRITQGSFFCTPINSPYTLHTDENWFGMWFHLKNNTFLSNRLKHGCIWQKSENIDQLHFATTQYLIELQKQERSYELLDTYAELIEISIRHDMSNTKDKQFFTFISKIKGNPALFNSADEAAEALGTTRYELNKRCMKEMGIRFSKFLIQAKMNLARKYLSRNCALADIAKSVGFADATSFSKAFKTYHNCTPKEFREVNGYKNIQYYI